MQAQQMQVEIILMWPSVWVYIGGLEKGEEWREM